MALLALAGCGLVAPAWAQTSAAAGGFAAAGAKARLVVEYRFEAEGQRENRHDRHRWKLLRSAELTAELVAMKPTPLPAMHALDAAQMAQTGRQQAQVQKTATQMAPMMAGAQAIIDKCGDDERCLEREAMKMGAALAGTQQLNDTLAAGREAAAVVKPGADRYQRWEGRTQQGRYRIDEQWQVVHADPICRRLPGARCTHERVLRGAGAITPSKSIAMVEVDPQGGSLMLTLPVPLAPLAYTETHTTDEPDGTHSVAPPKGPQPGQLMLRLTADGKPNPASLTVALNGGWRSQQGEQVLPMAAEAWHGAPGDGGRLVVRWHFSVP